MQRLIHRCPRCAQPLGISRDMWGQYYLCGACGFTAEDDDDLVAARHPSSPPMIDHLAQVETFRLRQPVSRR